MTHTPLELYAAIIAPTCQTELVLQGCPVDRLDNCRGVGQVGQHGVGVRGAEFGRHARASGDTDRTHPHLTSGSHVKRRIPDNHHPVRLKRLAIFTFRTLPCLANERRTGVTIRAVTADIQV